MSYELIVQTLLVVFTALCGATGLTLIFVYARKTDKNMKGIFLFSLMIMSIIIMIAILLG